MDDKEQQNSSVEVRIYGKSYRLKSDEDAEYVKKIAEYINSRMREIGTPAMPPLSVAVLAAIHITDELFKVRDEHTSYMSELAERERKMDERLSEALNIEIE